MPRGARDDSDVRREASTDYPLDVAELAARLGSPHSFYRWGNVLAIFSPRDGGGPFALDDYDDDYHARFFVKDHQPGCTSVFVHHCGVGSDPVSITFVGGLPDCSSMGFESVFCYYDGSPDLRFRLFVSDGSSETTYCIRLVYGVSRWSMYYLNSSNGWTLISDQVPVWNYWVPKDHFKMVVSLDAYEYAYVYLDRVKYSLVGKPAYHSAVSGNVEVVAAVELRGYSSSPADVLVGDCIVTTDEL